MNTELRQYKNRLQGIHIGTNGSFLTTSSWFGFPMVTMKYINDRKIDELLRSNPIVPIRYVTNTNATVSIEIYFKDIEGSRKSVKHSRHLDTYLTKMLLKLFRVYKGRFHPSTFLRETLPRYMAPRKSDEKTWFGMTPSEQQQKSITKNNAMQEYVKKLFDTTTKTMIHDKQLSIWNTKDCRDGIIVVPLKNMLKMMSSLVPAQVKKLLVTTWCKDFKSFLILKGSLEFIKRQGQYIYVKNIVTKTTYKIPIDQFVRIGLSATNNNNNNMTALKQYIDYEDMNSNTLREYAKQQGINMNLLSKVPGVSMDSLLVMLLQNQTIRPTNIPSIMKSLTPKMLRSVAQAVGASSMVNKKQFDEQKSSHNLSLNM
jgi:hypothetical protein